MLDPSPVDAGNADGPLNTARGPATHPRALLRLPLLTLLVVAVAGCASSNDSPSGPVTVPVALKIGEQAPPLSGTTLDGKTLDLASLRGHPVVVNFWGSWCVPCRSEFPELKTALEKHASDGLAVVGVLFKDQAAPARTFVAEAGATWPTLTDPSGSIARTYKVIAAPQSYFVDRSGVVRERQIGPVVTNADLETLLGAILK